MFRCQEFVTVTVAGISPENALHNGRAWRGVVPLFQGMQRSCARLFFFACLYVFKGIASLFWPGVGRDFEGVAMWIHTLTYQAFIFLFSGTGWIDSSPNVEH